MKQENILEMKGICKRFPGVTALNNVDFSVRIGEAHALMGENGAGKSTLIKVLTGVYSKDSGTVCFLGKEEHITNVIDAQKLGISTIYQEINLIPQLSVAENLFTGREIKKKGLIDSKEEKIQSEKILSDLGIHIDVTKKVSCYGIAVQQMITIARALSLNAKLVIMDEPTSSLSDDEVKVLFGVIDKLKKQNIAIIFISHRLGEIFEICERVTILKDGELVGSYLTKELTMIDLVLKMIGRNASKLSNERKTGFRETSDILLEARDIASGMRLRSVSLKIHRGEVVGLAGLLGSGRTELARVLFGADQMSSGEIFFEGKKVKFKHPKNAIEKGLAYLPESRKIDGIFPHLSVRENMCIVKLMRFARLGIINKKKQTLLTNEFIKRLKIKTPGTEQAIMNLSGGNQQKALLSRWLSVKPKLIILDEPTTGIDVGAKAEIEALIKMIAADGISVLFISSELDELVRNCDRIEIIGEGRNIGSVKDDEINRDTIMNMMAHSKGVQNCL